MVEFKKRKKNSLWYSPITLLVLFVLLLIFIYNILGLIKKEKETANKRNIALEEIELLNKRQQDILKDINKLQTKEGVEDIIRDKYQVVKEGEKLVIIVDQADLKPEAEENSEHGFFNWLKKFFNKK